MAKVRAFKQWLSACLKSTLPLAILAKIAKIIRITRSTRNIKMASELELWHLRGIVRMLGTIRAATSGQGTKMAIVKTMFEARRAGELQAPVGFVEARIYDMITIKKERQGAYVICADVLEAGCISWSHSCAMARLDASSRYERRRQRR